MGTWTARMVLATAALTSLLARSSAATAATAGRTTRASSRPLLGFIGGGRPAGAGAGVTRRALSTMMKSVADLRKEYSASGLEEAALPRDPFPLFRRWLEEAVSAQVGGPAGMGWGGLGWSGC